MNAEYGAWLTINEVTQNAINAMTTDRIIGVRQRYGWDQIEKSPGVYDFSSIRSAANLCRTNGLKFWFQSWADNNMPTFYYGKPYNIPRIYTDDNRFQEGFAYVINKTYKQKWYDFTRAIANEINNHPEIYNGVLVAWMPSEGTTGDTGWKKGNIVKVTINGVSQKSPQNYDISDSTWTATKQDYWKFLQGLTKYPLAYNPGNSSEYYDWMLANLSNRTFKTGDLGHQYGLDGEGTYQRRTNSDKSILYFSEFEGTDDCDWFTNQDFFVIVCSALSGNMKWLTVHNSLNSTRQSYLDFYNEYVNNAQAFSLPRTSIDYADTVTFPESIYGQLIDPKKLTSYNGSVTRINKDTTIGYWAKQDRISTLLWKNLNPARMKKLQDEFTTKGAKLITTNLGSLDGCKNLRNNDFGSDLWPGDYELNMKHISPFKFSNPAWRIGSSDFKIGRYAWDIDGEDYWSISDAISNPLYTGQKVTISVWYFDDDEADFQLGKWSAQTGAKKYVGTDGTEESHVIGGGTNTWNEAIFTLQNLLLGGKIDYGADISLKGKLKLGFITVKQSVPLTVPEGYAE